MRREHPIHPSRRPRRWYDAVPAQPRRRPSPHDVNALCGRAASVSFRPSSFRPSSFRASPSARRRRCRWRCGGGAGRGRVRAAPMDVFTAGRLAMFTDPTGADFAVWQPGDVSGLEVVMEPNSLCWTELYTTDATAARDFYRSVFAWTYQDMTMGGELVYSLASAPGAGDGTTPRTAASSSSSGCIWTRARRRSGTRTSA
ncbi:hypothetical protein NKH77_08385 [Streptomyces sp. M19]